MTKGEFNRFLVEVHKYCLPRLVRLNIPEHEAEDAFMEAIYQFWSDMRNGKIKHNANLKALVFVMSRNRWLGQLRKSKRGNLQEYSTDPADLLNVDQRAYVSQDATAFDLMLKKEEEESDRLEKKKKVKYFEQAFAKLSEKCRELLIQSIVNKRRLKKLKEKLGYVSVAAVKMAKSRCKKKLVEYYKDISLEA